jgi:hypothetical protein
LLTSGNQPTGYAAQDFVEGFPNSLLGSEGVAEGSNQMFLASAACEAFAFARWDRYYILNQ